MNIALILRAVITGLSLAGIAYITVAFALALVPFFYFACSLMVFMFCGLVAIADI